MTEITESSSNAPPTSDRVIVDSKQSRPSHVAHRPSSPVPKSSPPLSNDKSRPTNGPQNVDADMDDQANDSEAETVVLSSPNAKNKPPPIKQERSDGEDASDTVRVMARVNDVSDNKPHRSVEGSDAKRSAIGGADPKRDRTNAKGSVPTSPSSLATSRHGAVPSPAEGPQSPRERSVHSPLNAPTQRGRSSSIAESRKRKLRDETTPKLEPPRQRHKTEVPIKSEIQNSRNHPISPAPTAGRPHKRSASTQSVITSQNRRLRDVSGGHIRLHERKNSTNNSESSSEDTRSPPPHPLEILPPPRLSRASQHRSLTSPARAIAVHKKNVDKFGATQLAKACEKGDLDAVKVAYSDAPVEIDLADYAGITPLQKASLNGHADIVQFLLAKGCDPHCESSEKETPLMDAVENGHVDVIKILLERAQVDPHRQNQKGERAIDVLRSDDEDKDEIEALLKEAMRRESSNRNGKDTAYGGSSKQQTASDGLRYSKYDVNTLQKKAAEGNLGEVGELLMSGIKPNNDCGVAAARAGHYDVLSLLLASGLELDVDPAKHDTPMTAAIGRGHLKIIELLLSQDKFDPTLRNSDNKTYYELADDRRGPKWEKERDMLKDRYEEHRLRYPKAQRRRGQAQNTTPSRLRVQRKSPRPELQSSSPTRTESKRTSLNKSTSAPSEPNKPRGRLVSGKELSHQREVKRRRPVVDDSSESEGGRAERLHKKLGTKVKAESEGEERRPRRDTIRARAGSEDRSPPKKTSMKSRRADSDDEKHREGRKGTKQSMNSDNDHEHRPKKSSATHRPVEREKLKKQQASRQTTADVSEHEPPAKTHSSKLGPQETKASKSSNHERQSSRKSSIEVVSKNKTQSPDVAMTDVTSPKSPPGTPEPVRQARREEARRAEEQAARERQEAIERVAAEKAEKAAKERAAAEQAARDREAYLSTLPPTLRAAVELGPSRPLYLTRTEVPPSTPEENKTTAPDSPSQPRVRERMGIANLFLPLHLVPRCHIDPGCSPALSQEPWLLSIHAVGVLGPPTLDIPAHFPAWTVIEITTPQREAYLKCIDIEMLAQVDRAPGMWMAGFEDTVKAERIEKLKEGFRGLKEMWWIKLTDLEEEVKKRTDLRGLELIVRWDVNLRENNATSTTTSNTTSSTNGSTNGNSNGTAGSGGGGDWEKLCRERGRMIV